MTGKCKDCANYGACQLLIGKLYGGCFIYFEPKDNEKESKKEKEK